MLGKETEMQAVKTTLALLAILTVSPVVIATVSPVVIANTSPVGEFRSYVQATGDLNNDGARNIADFIILSEYLGSGARHPGSGLRPMDINGDGSINVSDPIWIIAFLFGGGPSICLDAQDTDNNGAP